jgi:hypothetical protein
MTMALPAFTHQLTVTPNSSVISQPYEADSLEHYSLLLLQVKSAEPINYPQRGDTITIKAKTTVSRSIPKLEKEKYNFSIYEA